jgi:uncharacterized protein (TIGR03089 family)
MVTTASVPALLRALVADPGRPRLTWYGDGGERIELSGHVLDNWVTKTTNLLLEEYDAGPGTRVLVDLPAHWRTVVWALSVWRTGACVVLPGTSPTTDVDVVVTHRPADWSRHPDVVAVALPALARSVEGPLPAGAVDANAAVMSYGDVLTFAPEADPGQPALVGEEAVRHGDLMAWARSAGGDLWPGGPAGDGAPGDTAGAARSDTASAPRVLLEPADPAPAPVLAAVLAVYAVDGSVVLCAPEVTRSLRADHAARERLVGGERIS